MKAFATSLVRGAAALALLGMAGAPTRHDLAPGTAPADAVTLQFETYQSPAIPIVEIDGHPVEVRIPAGRQRVVDEYVLAPGPHTIKLRAEGGAELLPDVIVLEGSPGQRYRLVTRLANLRTTEDDATTLHFNCYTPMIVQGEGKRETRVGAGPLPEFPTSFDAARNVLLYEDASVPLSQTARVAVERHGLVKVQNAYLFKIEGGSGARRILYRLHTMGKDTWQYRLLPGEYQFAVGYWAATGATSLDTVPVVLQAEAGHTYRLKENIDWKGATKHPAGTMAGWAPAFEDATGTPATNE